MIVLSIMILIFQSIINLFEKLRFRYVLTVSTNGIWAFEFQARTSNDSREQNRKLRFRYVLAVSTNDPLHLSRPSNFYPVQAMTAEIRTNCWIIWSF